MIKVIDVVMNSQSWTGHDIDDKPQTLYWECPIVNKLLNEGWNIKEFQLSKTDCIFIFEKPDNMY